MTTLKRMGKKGAIPVLSEIVNFFVNSAPKPLLFLIFIFLIGVFGSFVLPYVLQSFGYNCVAENGNIELYQVPMENLLKYKAQNIQQATRDILGFEEFALPDDPFPNGNKALLRIPDRCIRTETINGSDIVGYSSLCATCNTTWTLNPSVQGYFGQLYSEESFICLSDGYAKNLSNIDTLTRKKFCSVCSIPNPYYYNKSNCNGQDSCFWTITDESLIPQVSDSLTGYELRAIKQFNGVKRSQSSSDVVNVQCEEEHRPQLYFFSIKIFDKYLWLFLIIGYFLVTFAYAYYSQVL